MSIHEIVLPETEPETEWILGRAVRKVSPFRTHALLQRTLSTALAAWADGHGDVGPEWRFRPAPAGEIRRPLVPDVSYVSDARLAGLEGRDLETPPFSPDVAVEVLSPDDRARNVEHKIAVYLATGSALVIVVDPRDRRCACTTRAACACCAATTSSRTPRCPGSPLRCRRYSRRSSGGVKTAYRY